MALKDFPYNSTTGAAGVSIEGAPDTAYILVEADDLDFGNPDQSPIPLAGASASIGSLDGDAIVTDMNGDATVSGIALGTSKGKTFIRAETP